MVSSTGSLIVLLAYVTTANIPDNQVYPEPTPTPLDLSSEIIKKVNFMVADPGYDDQDLYESSLKMGF